MSVDRSLILVDTPQVIHNVVIEGKTRVGEKHTSPMPYKADHICHKMNIITKVS